MATKLNVLGHIRYVKVVKVDEESNLEQNFMRAFIHLSAL